jgi:hypothetical protein
MNHQLFYSELGKLLYAIADADHFISNSESATLKNVVRNELVFLETSMDPFKTESAYYTEFEFDFLDETIADPKDALQSFIDFIEEHKNEISRKLLLASRRAATKIAEAYHNTNQQENVFLKEAESHINKILQEKINDLPGEKF